MRIILTGLLLLSIATTALAAEDELPTFGDWAKKCESTTSPEGKDNEICYIFQTVSNKENGQMIMQARVGYAPERNQPVLIITVPLGALLPPGAAFVAEGADPLKLTYLACGHEGCTTVGEILDDKVLTAMRKGDRATVRVGLLNNKILPIPISLKGFTRAFNSLETKK